MKSKVLLALIALLIIDCNKVDNKFYKGDHPKELIGNWISTFDHDEYLGIILYTLSKKGRIYISVYEYEGDFLSKPNSKRHFGYWEVNIDTLIWNIKNNQNEITPIKYIKTKKDLYTDIADILDTLITYPTELIPVQLKNSELIIKWIDSKNDTIKIKN